MSLCWLLLIVSERSLLTGCLALSASSTLMRSKKVFFMEGSRLRGRRLLGHAARRVAATVVEPTSPRRRRGRRSRLQPVEYRLVRPRVAQGWDDAPPFEFLGTVRNERRRRSPSPPLPPSPPPDPDDDPAPASILAALPRSIARRERMNLDTEFYTGIPGGLALWTVPRESFVGIARGTGYADRATAFVRVERIAIKLIAEQPAISHFNTNATNPLYADPVNVFNKCHFRLAVIYDKQSDGSDPTVLYPNVFSTNTTYATLSFRDPDFVHRYDVLYDNTFEWRTGEITEGAFSNLPGEFVSWYAQTGNRQREEIFIDCDKLVHYSADTGAVASIASGNIFIMFCMIGNTYANTSTWINVRTTYSDNLNL